MWQAAEQPVPKLNLARATSALHPTTAAPSAKAAARPMSAAEARPKSASRTARATSASAPNPHGATSLGPRAALLAQQARTSRRICKCLTERLTRRLAVPALTSCVARRGGRAHDHHHPISNVHINL